MPPVVRLKTVPPCRRVGPLRRPQEVADFLRRECRSLAMLNSWSPDPRNRVARDHIEIDGLAEYAMQKRPDLLLHCGAGSECVEVLANLNRLDIDVVPVSSILTPPTIETLYSIRF